MKRVTITYTRPDSNTPWYWEASEVDIPIRSFILENSDRMEQTAWTEPLKNIVQLDFADELIYEQFKQFIDSNVKTEYVQYCIDNNITIDTAVENI